jgi:hypothetical protein
VLRLLLRFPERVRALFSTERSNVDVSAISAKVRAFVRSPSTRARKEIRRIEKRETGTQMYADARRNVPVTSAVSEM